MVVDAAAVEQRENDALVTRSSTHRQLGDGRARQCPGCHSQVSRLVESKPFNQINFISLVFFFSSNNDSSNDTKLKQTKEWHVETTFKPAK